MAATATAKTSKRKHISRKKSLRRSEFYQTIRDKLVANFNYDESTKRNLPKDVIAATIEVMLENAVADKGIMLPGLGKITFRYRKAREAGTSTSFGVERQVTARPASWIPKFRLQKRAKLALLEATPKA